MKLLLFTKFWPSVGGIETLTETLVNRWSKAGIQTIVVTDVPASSTSTRTFTYQVLRQPSNSSIMKIVRQCDLVATNNISLKTCWVAWMARKPLLAIHHSYYHPFGKVQPALEKLKVFLTKLFAHNICVSMSVANTTGIGGTVISNPYDVILFQLDATVPRDRELIFVGRLVSDKGVNTLLDAIVLLRDNNLFPSLTVVGDGPERGLIERQISSKGLAKQVVCTGNIPHAQLAEQLNRHRIMVIPSLWDEPFGIVALEGAACGCVVVGSSGGGLPEAIGPCGPTFENGNARALAGELRKLMLDTKSVSGYLGSAPMHLLRHTAEHVASAYADVFRRILKRGG